jgi:hypothetical protein
MLGTRSRQFSIMVRILRLRKAELVRRVSAAIWRSQNKSRINFAEAVVRLLRTIHGVDPHLTTDREQ